MRNLRIASITLVFISVLVAALTAGCSKEPASSTFRPLNEAETQKFIADSNINALAVKNFKKATIILYETKTETGHYALAFDENGKLFKNQMRIGNDASETPVSTDDGLDFGTIIINDKKILKKAYKITVQFADGGTLTEPINGRKGFIVPHEKTKHSNAGIETVIISDEHNRVIFESP